MRYAKKSPEELQALRRTLVSRLAQSQPGVAEAARWIRDSLGLNQREFAKLVGLSTPQVARLERGEANPTLETLLAVGKPYGLGIGFSHPDMLVQQSAPATDITPSQAVEPKVKIPRLNFNKPADG
ncbi:helix-turn-helix transcriptional regulator [Chitinivorax sp. PXF-14]|uniref:helix-turn-helix domain-containing protein n=1 Tax=Chitinivorax sp. PXF-14 TaxID=3230488 RepID=UPI003467058C